MKTILIKRLPLVKKNDEGVLMEYTTMPTSVLSNLKGYDVQEDCMWINIEKADKSKHKDSFVNLRRKYRGDARNA